MSAHGGVPRAWGTWLGREQVDAIERDVRDELEAHLEHAIAERVADGLDPETARREARAAFGDVERTVRACVRQKLGGRLMWTKIHVAVTVLLLVGIAMILRQNHAVQARLRMEANEARALAAQLAQRRDEPREIRLGVGDRISVVASEGYQDLDRLTFVEQDGTALFQPAGRLEVHGLLRAELEALLREELSAYYEDPPELYVRVEQD